MTLAALLLLAAPPAEPPTAESLALRMLDGEALYTVTGGLKPVSDGFWQTRFPEAADTSPAVEEARRLLAGLPLGPDLEAGVYVFVAPFDGKRMASAFVAHRPALAALVARQADVFAPVGIVPGPPAQQVMERIDRAPRAARWRAFGLVFGYPEYAVEFFVAAGEEQERTGIFVKREFRHLPTFAADDGRFVYAVPKGHNDRPEDIALGAATAPVFTRYKAWRAVYLDKFQLGAVELLRHWIPAGVPACGAAVIPAPVVEGHQNIPPRPRHRLRFGGCSFPPVGRWSSVRACPVSGA